MQHVVCFRKLRCNFTSTCRTICVCRRSGKIGVDFSLFDATQRRGSSAPPDEAAVAEASGSAAAGPAPGPSNGGGSPLAAPPSAALPSNKWPRGRLGEQRQQQEDGALPLGSPFESESYLARKSPSLPPV